MGLTDPSFLSGMRKTAPPLLAGFWRIPSIKNDNIIVYRDNLRDT